MTQQDTKPRTNLDDHVPYREVTFDSGGSTCHAWHFPATDPSLETTAGRPCAVLAHGLAGTKDSGLAPFAETLAAGGLDVLAFDYRGFGASGGTLRQVVSLAGQVDDYRAAMRTAAKLTGVDPARLVLWGSSLSGGHVIAAAAGRTDVAAVVAMSPLVDGLAAAKHALAAHKPTTMAGSTVKALRSRLSTLCGGRPAMLPVVARDGAAAALSSPGYYDAYIAMAGPSWRNEVDASLMLQLGGYRPGKQAERLRCPLLVQVADYDRCAPPHAATKAAFAARAEVRHYPCDHFDVWPGRQWFDAASAHQVNFLQRQLAPK